MSNTRKATAPLDLDVLIAETVNEPYTFTLGKAERTLPHAKNLTVTQMRSLDRGDLEVVLPQIVDDEDTVSVIIGLPSFALEALIQRWLKHSGVDVGESAASSRS